MIATECMDLFFDKYIGMAEEFKEKSVKMSRMELDCQVELGNSKETFFDFFIY